MNQDNQKGPESLNSTLNNSGRLQHPNLIDPSLSDFKSRFLSQHHNPEDTLAQDFTFFDHHRVKSLGGQLDDELITPQPKLTNHRPIVRIDNDNPEPKLTNHRSIKQINSDSPQPKPANRRPIMRIEDDNLGAKVWSSRTAIEGPGKNHILSSEKRETGWLASIKWLTRLCLSLVFLVWIFILGVLVGRGSLWDNPLSEKTIKTLDAVLNQSLPPRNTATYNPENLNTSQTYSFPPTASLRSDLPILGNNLEEDDVLPPENTEEIANKFAPAEESNEIPPVEEIKPEPLAKKTVPAPAPTQDIAVTTYDEAKKNLKPVAKPKIATPESETPLKTQTAKKEADFYFPEKPQGQGQFTVQVASAFSETEAKNAVRQYQKKGFKAYTYLDSKGRYPIRVDRFNNKEEAEATVQKLANAGAKGPYVSKLND